MRFKQVWSVYKALLNTHYGLSAMKDLYFVKRQRLWELVLVVAGLLVTAASVGFICIGFATNVFSVGSMFGEPEIILSISIVASALVTFTFSLGLVISAFYFSDDIKTLMPLPLKPLEVLTAKFATIFTSQYLILAAFILPIWIYYGIKLDASFFYYVKALIGFVFLPIIPLVIATLLSVVLMRVVNVSKRKDLLTMIGGLLLLVVIIGSQLYFQMQATENPEVFMEQLVMQTTSIVKTFGRAFPPSIWLTSALAQPGLEGLLYLLLFIGLTLLFFLVLLFVAQKVFYKSVLLGMESGKTSQKKKTTAISYTSRSKVTSLALSDCKMFLRNPSYVLNGLIGYVLLPFLLIFQQVTLGSSLEEISVFIGNINPSLILLIVALYYSVMGVMSSVPATPFSREGKYLWNLRSLPVSAKEAMLAKLMSAQIINFIGSALGVVALGITLKLPAMPIVLGSIWGLVLSTATSSFWVLLDLFRPMLNWTNPTKAIKSNVNVIFAMFGTIGIILGVAARVAVHVQSGAFNQMLLEFGGFTAVVLFLGYFLWDRFGEKAYKSLG